MMPQNPIVGGTVLRIPAIQSPNFVSGVSGWTINADGTAQFNQLTLIVQATAAAVLIYNGVAALGTLIGSWAGTAGTDPYGNAYPAGLSAQQGTLTGMTISVSTLINSLIQSGTITNSAMSGSAINAGTMTDTKITFTQSGLGSVLIYSTSTTTVTQTVTGVYNFTAPAGVTSAKVECWGAGAGGGGGNNTRGGFGAGGGEYAAEPNYPLTPGTTYVYAVGNGGTGGSTGNAGTTGLDTWFDNGNVYAFSGSGTGGSPGGTGSPNSVTNDGGAGGANSGFTGGGGGGGSGGSTGAGGAGTAASGSSGAAGGAAGTGGGASGGTGGNANANGVAGGSPGAGGGGAGVGTSVTNKTKTYTATTSYAYYGHDVGDGLENTNGVVLQGVPNTANGTFPGNQYSFVIFPYATIRSDFSGYTIDKVTFQAKNQHTWYNSGGSMVWGYTGHTSFGSTGSTGFGTSNQKQFFFKQGQQLSGIDVSSNLNSIVATTSFTGFMIGPSPTYSNLNYYGYWDAGNAGTWTMTVIGHTGSSGFQTAGNGADGQVKITYTSGTTLIGSISPVAGTDASSNAYPQGIAGVHAGTDYATLTDNGSNAGLLFGAAGSAADASITRESADQITFRSGGTEQAYFFTDGLHVLTKFFGTSGVIAVGDEIGFATGAGTIDGWNAVSLTGGPAGISGSIRVKRMPWKSTWLDCEISFTTLVANSTTTIGSLPSAAYYPTAARQFALGVSGTVTNANTPRIFVPTSGAVQLILPIGANGAGCSVMYPTD